MPPVHVRRRRLGTLVALSALVLAACGGGGGPSREPETERAGDAGRSDFVAQVASYELVANRDQRFLAALAGSGSGRVVSFGSVGLQFFYLGTRSQPLDPPQPAATTTAAFLPIAGSRGDPAAPAPRAVKPSEGLGVYSAQPVRFDRAGFWGVTVKADVDGKPVSANAAFEVYETPRLPFPGQPAPRTENPLPGATGIDPVAIDSRAQGGEPIPDAALHTTSVAAALAAGRPTVVVVSTPVYCVSRFCGPVTDVVADLAGRYGDRVAFVHLEVWEDFENKVLSRWAAEWIRPGGQGDAQEPWVFVVGGDGIVRERFDNVVGEQDLEAAVQRLAG